MVKKACNFNIIAKKLKILVKHKTLLEFNIINLKKIIIIFIIISVIISAVISVIIITIISVIIIAMTSVITIKLAIKSNA